MRFKTHPDTEQRRSDGDRREGRRVDQREKGEGEDWAMRGTRAESLSQ